MDRARLKRIALAPLVFPHELGHALPALLAGLPYTVELLPEWDGPAQPLGRFDAVVDDGTSPTLIRTIAVAPLPIFVGLAVALRTLVAPPPGLALPLVALCAFWGTLSDGDLAVAADPDAAREAGEFVATVAGWERAAADALAVGTTFLVAGILLV